MIEPMNKTYDEWIPSLLSIIFEASDRIMAVYQSQDFDMKVKEDDSPVTKADIESDRIIREGLRALESRLPVLSEEGESIPFDERSQWARYWLVDPLDGTRQFVNRTGEFTINIALIDQHEPVIGVVAVPQENRCYWAVRDQGAFSQVRGEKPQPIQTNTIVPDILSVLVSHQFTKSQKSKRILERLGEHRISYCGSSLKICLIAKGEADLYPRVNPCYEWDTAAGQCILEAAGGKLIDFSGKPLRYNEEASLMSPNYFAISNSQLTSICCG